jgi:hypothetical protein
MRGLQAEKFKVQFLDAQRATERHGAIVRLSPFEELPITPLLFGLSSLLYLFFQDSGCTQVHSSPSLASRYGWVDVTYLDMGQLS